jgi:hypothetical protein
MENKRGRSAANASMSIGEGLSVMAAGKDSPVL